MAATQKHLNNGGASGVLFTDRRDFYIDPQVTKELWTDVSPFTTVISNKETRQTNDPLFKMFEHRNPWVKQEFQTTDVQAIASDNAEDTCTIKSGSIVGLEGEGGDNAYTSWIGLECEIWDSTKSTRRGSVLITNVTGSGSSADFNVKNLGNSTITTAANDYFVVIGSAHGEGTEAPEAWSDELQIVWNSCQIFKTPLQITGTLLQAALRGESSELARLRLQKSQEHKMQKERAFLFGTRKGGTGLGEAAGQTSTDFTTTGEDFTDGDITDAAPGGVAANSGNVVRTTYGVVSSLLDYGASSGDHQNVFTVDSSYGYSNFVDDMEKVFQYVPEVGVKRAFCGAGAMGYWSKLAGASGMAGNSGWTVNLSDMKRDTLGFNYKILETPHGILQLIPTPALRGPYNKYMLVIDESNMFHAQYRSQMYQTNIKSDNAFDGVKDQYFSDEGVGISLLESHNLFKITA